MSMTEIDNGALADKLIATGATRDEIMLVSRNHLAGLLEHAGEGHEAGNHWGEILTINERLIKQNLNRAFEFGVSLTEYSSIPSRKESVEVSREWLFGTALLLLSDERLIPLLEKYLITPEGNAFYTSLTLALQDILNPPSSIHGLSQHPECFSTVVAAKIALLFKNNARIEDLDSLTEDAKLAIVEPEFQQVLEIYRQIPDTKDLADFFDQYLAENK